MFFGVTDGTRTHNQQDHNLRLHQLSHGHTKEHKTIMGASCFGSRPGRKHPLVADSGHYDHHHPLVPHEVLDDSARQPRVRDAVK